MVESLLAGKSADKMARLLRLCGIVTRMRMKLLLHATTTRAYTLIRSPSITIVEYMSTISYVSHCSRFRALSAVPFE